MFFSRCTWHTYMISEVKETSSGDVIYHLKCEVCGRKIKRSKMDIIKSIRSRSPHYNSIEVHYNAYTGSRVRNIEV